MEGYIAGLKTAQLTGEVPEMDPTVAAWALMGMGELIGMRWVLWDEEGTEPVPGALTSRRKSSKR